MNKFLFFLVTAFSATSLSSQTDNCALAPTLSVTATCSSPISGTSFGATQTIPGCVGIADDDVWYKFVATLTSHSLTVSGSASFDPVLEVFSGTCISLVSLACVDNTFNGQTESISLTGLTIGTTYYIRVFHYGVGSGSSNFTICLTNPPPPPVNDACAGSINLVVNTSCSGTNGTTYGATQSLPGCAGAADDDVWYRFTANSYTQAINITGSASMDAVLELFNGSACGSLTSIVCMDNTFSGGIETINATGLVPGQVYYFRVYDYYFGGSSQFTVCVVGNPIVAGTQPNDNPCSAILLPSVTSSCNYLSFSTIGATATSLSLAPTPSACGGSVPMIGGYSATSRDVWFKVVAPSNGNLYITPQPNFAAPSSTVITDGVMALYSGACGSLVQIRCADDNITYPGSGNDLLPYIAATGLIPGATYYIRYWGYGSASGVFGLCVQSPTNDNCSNALYVCDINGYAGSTSAAYTPDRPGTGAGQMFGNNETSAGVNQTNGINSGGVFGYYPFPGTVAGPWSSPALDVNIENNSWIRFTAAGATANLRVTVGNCWVGNFPTGGVQMQIFSGLACNSFSPVSSFREGSNTFTVSAVGLTTGNDYYLMVDGYAGDICNYTIQALNGVAFPAIKALPDSVCQGNSTVLTAPSGATSYQWLPGGQTTQTISVLPGSTQTFSCIASGVCGNKQTLAKTIVVKPLPVIIINSGASISTCGTQTTNLIGSGATSYTWNTGNLTNTLNVSPASTTSYTLSGRTNGCASNAVTTITVNPVPTVVTAPTVSVCSGSSVTLTASGASTYTWSPGGIGSSIIISPSSNTIYNVTGSNAQGCTRTVSSTITVNAKPSIFSTNTSICFGNSGTISSTGGVSYVWNTSATTSSITLSPLSTTTYTVIGTGANSCTNLAVAQISVIALPIITVASGTICQNRTYTLTANGGNLYNWSTAQSGTFINVTPTVTTVYTVTGTAVSTCSNVTTATVTVRNLPQITPSPIIFPSNCSASTGSITSVSVTGAPTLSYSWTNSSNTLVGSSTNLLNQPAGTYNLQVTDGLGCQNLFGPYSITNPGAPSAPSSSATANSMCIGAPINLFANGTLGVTYNWSGPNSFSSTSQNPSIPVSTGLMTGIYSVYTTSAGCSGPASSVTITINALPNPSANSSAPNYCVGNSVTLFASTASTYTWTGPNTFTSNAQNPFISPVTIATAGLYQLTVTNSNGCVNTTTVNVVINNNPSVLASANSGLAICENMNISLNSSGGNTYNWFGPNGFSSNLQNPNIPIAGTVSSGQYTVTVTNTLTSCSSVALASVTVSAIPSFTATASASACNGALIQLNAGGSALTYTWTGPGTYFSNSQNPIIANANISNIGTYTVLGTNANNCSSIQTVNVSVYSPVVLTASVASQSICSGNNIDLSGTGGGSYSWVGPNNFLSSIQNPSISNASLLASGNYSLTVTDANGCDGSAIVNVIIRQTPILISNSTDSTCNGGVLLLTANFGAGASVSWFADFSVSTVLASNTNSYSPTPSGNGVYTYYAQATLNGCISAVTPITANYFNINAIASADVYSGNAPLSVNFLNGSTGVTITDNFNWNFGNGVNNNNMNPNYIFNNGGTYNVILTVTDAESGCSDTALVTIKVEDDIVIVIPNVFTPNGDGRNDLFNIKLTGAKNAEGYIYNRWGQLLHSWNALNDSWDGKASNGVDCPDSSYFYIIKVIDNKDKEHVFPGYVLIIR